jgi:hypothetical protein
MITGDLAVPFDRGIWAEASASRRRGSRSTMTNRAWVLVLSPADCLPAQYTDPNRDLHPNPQTQCIHSATRKLPTREAR